MIIIHYTHGPGQFIDLKLENEHQPTETHWIELWDELLVAFGWRRGEKRR